MLIIKAFHIIAMVCWFAGLFYLPRLFVYHSSATDTISLDRFIVMERRLFYGITWPSAILTTGLGLWLISFNPAYYLHAKWMHIKLALVIALWVYHFCCGHFLKRFAQSKNNCSERFFRLFNEFPTLLLVSIVLLVVIKP